MIQKGNTGTGALHDNNNLQAGNIVISDQKELTKFNAQVVPVITDKDDIQLRDYVPNIGALALESDNSSDYQDDFSLAPSII